MIIRSEKEYLKCKELHINITTNKEICELLAKSIGLPEPNQIIKEDFITAVMGEGVNNDTNQYLLITMAVIEGKAYYQALTCFNIKTTGLVAYCYLQEKKDRMSEETVSFDGEDMRFKSVEELKTYLAEGKL